MFSPHGEVMMVCVSFDGEQEWRIVLSWPPDRHDEVTDEFNLYIEPLETGGAI
jgi:hypothetical protein